MIIDTALNDKHRADVAKRMTWGVTRSCDCEYETLLVKGRDAASVMGCPAGSALRMHWLPFEAPCAHDVYPARDEATRAVENWLLGLDIVPWD